MYPTIPKLLSRSLTALAAAVTIQVLSAVSLNAAVITNDAFATTTSGTRIYAQGGGIFKFGSKWYWYGAKYNGAVTYADNPAAGKNSDTSFNSIMCYSSTDLVNWVDEGAAIAASGISGESWIGRCGVAYHAATATYVLVAQYSGTLGAGVFFATSSTPNGTFTWHHLQTSLPTSSGLTGDQSVFIDNNGAAYLVCCNSSGRQRQYVLPFRSSDYLAIETGPNIALTDGREGNCMLRYGNRYYMLTSNLHGWNASPAFVLESTGSNIVGTYNTEYTMNRSALDFAHVTQTGAALTVAGSSASLGIFVGDRWCDFAGNGVGYNQWCPLSFSGTTPTFQSVSKWDLNASTGTWSVVNGNNHILNPNYEADRVAQTTVAGWGSTGAGYGNVVNASHNPGRFCFQHTGSGTGFTNQFVTGLPNGTYTLKVWYKSSGGQSTGYVFVRGYGGSQVNSNVNTAASSWTQKTISGIVVTNGTCEVGLYTVRSSGQWVQIDDWSLTK